MEGNLQHVRTRGRLGDDISTVAKQMVYIAKKQLVVVDLKFNEVELTATPGDAVADVIDQFWKKWHALPK